MGQQSTAPDSLQVRLDKWLWAARFFKTRNLAKQAIEGGKVYCNGQRVKASKEIIIEFLSNYYSDYFSTTNTTFERE